ncbi:MAG: DUF2147 domain-containing protein [Pseudomonadota bacterium]
MKPGLFSTVLAAFLAAGTASAGDLRGDWRTEPDRKGQTGDVQVTPCGVAFCGTIVRAHDKTGAQITTPNVGRQILFDFAKDASGAYTGEVYVPLMKAKFAATIRVSGASMTMRACNAMGVCRTQTWSRVP